MVWAWHLNLWNPFVPSVLKIKKENLFFFKNGRKIKFTENSRKISFWQNVRHAVKFQYFELYFFCKHPYFDSYNWSNSKNIVLYEVIGGHFWEFREFWDSLGACRPIGGVPLSLFLFSLSLITCPLSIIPYPLSWDQNMANWLTDLMSCELC